jgi:hypothetical protein
MRYEAPAIVERVKLTALLTGKNFHDSPHTYIYDQEV